MHKTHTFTAHVRWEAIQRTKGRGLSRAHIISAPDVPEIRGSAAKVFHGDADRWNPEQMLLGAIAQCHMLTFLYLAQSAGISVLSYESHIEGEIGMDPDGVGGEFTQVTIHPVVTVDEASLGDPQDIASVDLLHDKVHEYCFIARSVRAPITIKPQTSARSTH